MHKSLNWLLTFGQSYLFTMTNSIVTLATPMKVATLGGTPVDIGTAGLAFGVTNTFTPLLSGWVSDRIGRRPTMLIGYAMSASACLLLMTTDRLWTIPLFVILHTAGSQGIWPVIEAWLADRSTSSISHQMTIYNLGWSSGGGIGSMYVGFFIALGAGFQTVYLTAAGIIGFLTLVRIAIPDRGAATAILELHEEEGAREELTAAEKLQARGRLHCVWLASFGAWYFHSVINWIFTYDALIKGISPQLIGNLHATMTWMEFATFIAIIFYRRWYLSTNLRTLSQLVGIGGAILFGTGMVFYGQFNTLPLLALGLATYGVGLAAIYSASLVVSVTSLHDRGARAGIHEMLVGLGSVSAPWVSGHFLQYFGGSTDASIGQLAVYGTAAGVMLLVLGAQAIVGWRVRGQLARLNQHRADRTLDDRKLHNS